jgi:stress-induced morphogen
MVGRRRLAAGAVGATNAEGYGTHFQVRIASQRSLVKRRQTSRYYGCPANFSSIQGLHALAVEIIDTERQS